MENRTHLGLFEGIGGFSYAAAQVGFNTVAWCEINEFCQTILKYHFPEAQGYSDIKNTDFKKYANKIDVLTGGFPCQPYSTAGLRKGNEDERHLWPEMLRAIQEIQPKWIVGENVLGLVNWNNGMVFEQICSDLETQGYEVQSFILPACGVNAPHRRERIWIVAHSVSLGHRGRSYKQKSDQQKEWPICFDKIRYENGIWTKAQRYSRLAPYSNSYGYEWGRFGQNRSKEATIERQKNKWERIRSEFERVGAKEFTTDSNKLMHKRRNTDRKKRTDKSQNAVKPFNEPTNWKEFPTQSPVCFGNDGISERLDASTVLKKGSRAKAINHWRNESLKGAGNAIVPQVAIQIFKVIEKML